jgi:uncharacterized protein (DUF885 family)
MLRLPATPLAIVCSAWFALAPPAQVRAQTQARTTPAPSQRVSALLADVEQRLRTTSFDRQISGEAGVPRLPEVSRAAWRADAALWRSVGSRAGAIPTASLSEEERLTLQLLQWEARLEQARALHWWVDFSTITPYASPLGGIARALGTLTIGSPSDTARYLTLLRGVAILVDSIRAGVEQRAERGIRLAKPALPASIALLRSYAVRGATNPFAVADGRLASLDAPTRAAMARAAGEVVDDAIVPAVERLLALLTGPYAAQAPDRVGLAQYPGGDAYYRWLVRLHTTLETTPEAVHRTGLEQVQRIEREMAAIRAELGFSGSKAEFHAQLAANPRFFARTPEEFGERLMLYAARLDPLLDRAFATRPRARGDVRRLPPALEPAMTFGYYQVPTTADSVGHYYFNGTQLEQRSLLTAAPLIAHELWPGHHFQVNLARENTALPDYRRQRYYTAYGEGWGDYASIVAGELGLYADPYDRYGRLAMDMFISCRLVVDTGMNALGWSRERAIAFLREHALESETQIGTETLRYSTDLPGQALAYKMGSLEFERMRRRAEAALGNRFDARAFHALVLGSGMLPLTVLGARVEGWIASQGAR